MPLVQHNQPEPPFRDLLALETSPPGDPSATDNVRPGPEREAMLRKARLMETALHIDEGWHARFAGPALEADIKGRTAPARGRTEAVIHRMPRGMACGRL